MPTRKKSTASPLKAYIDEINDLPADVLLGRIVLFRISESPVSYSDVVSWFTEFGLDEKFLPAPNKAVDAFKKATSDTKDSYPMSRDRTGMLLCRDLASTTDYIQRRITREIKDSKKRDLGYDPAITVTFHRPINGDQATARMDVRYHDQDLERPERPFVHRVGKDIEERFVKHYAYLDSQKMRGVVRDYLKKLNAIEIKGGVYFVLSTRDEELGRLAAFVNRLGTDCLMDMIPVPSMDKTRELMARIFEREAAERLQNIANEARLLISSRKTVTGASYAKLKAEYDQTLNNAEEHMFTLQISQDLTAASAEVALDALGELLEASLREEEA